MRLWNLGETKRTLVIQIDMSNSSTFAGLVHKNNYIYDLDEPVYLLFILQFHRVYLILP